MGREASDVPVLVITAFADVETAVKAMKAGANDFIGKPFNRDYLLLTIEKALNTHELGKEVKRRLLLGSFVLSANYYDSYYTKAQKVRRPLVVHQQHQPHWPRSARYPPLRGPFPRVFPTPGVDPGRQS